MRDVLGAAIFILALACGPANAIGMCGSGPRINCIVDGDTFWLNGEKFRAVGYDTPETTTNLCGGNAERQLGQQASRRLMQLFNETQITLLRQGEDRYGRTLAVVRSDGVNVGDILIGEGLARSWPDGCEFWCGACQ
ncbi:thermonuclease family protein [Nioella aestuarii]|uniref:thermonuclease family protein n=1 Tax=Nioella aestuarii TaxID=1662864 RepID=UPI003D7FF128